MKHKKISINFYEYVILLFKKLTDVDIKIINIY